MKSSSSSLALALVFPAKKGEWVAAKKYSATGRTFCNLVVLVGQDDQPLQRPRMIVSSVEKAKFLAKAMNSTGALITSK